MDGILDEALWSTAAPLTGMVQRDSSEGTPASEGTTVRIVYTADAICFGFKCQDSQPEAIVATERWRDEELTKDDSVAVLLDTFYDRRNAFSFAPIRSAPSTMPFSRYCQVNDLNPLLALHGSL